MAGDLYNINVIYNPSTPEEILVSVADIAAGVPNGGTTHQTLTKNSATDGDASWKNIRGFTFVQDTVPTPTRIGETFFDISTGVTSGNAYVVVDNGSGGLIWVQFAPGSGVLTSAPRGVVAYAQRTTNQATITTVVDITSLSVTWTADPSRRYKTSFICSLYSSVANDGPMIQVTDSSGATTFARGTVVPPVSNAGLTCVGSVIESGLSGSITRKVRASRAFGTGVVTFEGNTGFPAYILVEDIGAV